MFGEYEPWCSSHDAESTEIEDKQIIFFWMKDRNLFHRLDTIGYIFTSGATTSENITDGVHEMK